MQDFLVSNGFNSVRLALNAGYVDANPDPQLLYIHANENPELTTWANPEHVDYINFLARVVETLKDRKPSVLLDIYRLTQRVHVMNGAEFDELRRKLRMQTASRRYRKRKKDEARQQKMKIQELQSELFRLQELEAQSKKYQERSQESLESELKIHEDEIGNLWGKMQEAAKEELDWVSMMSSHLSD
ncbi:cell 5a endo1 [Phytophthora cinnamomi]|uniref:cell 5a endo1 n=1 Tax=Phytophthora cinnamomi TaxID=4785 RepID=UPI0035594560|nr:cell 5a endo1 [Phytophthora cinnamomi]